MKHKQLGFIALELVAVMLLAAGLAVLLLPGLTPAQHSSELDTARLEFTETLHFARSEAIARGLPVIVSANAPQFGNEYGGGWRSFVDENRNGRCDAGELIEMHGALPSNTTLRAAGNRAEIHFDAKGYLDPQARLQMSLCGTRHAGSYLLIVQTDGLLDVKNDALCP